MRKNVTTLIATLLLILSISTFLIFQARGYKLDFKNKKIEKTGIIAVSSLPTGAAVYLNGHLTSATNTNLADLVPGEYSLKVTKAGYSHWEKKIQVEAELVTPVDITLFPSVPDLSPLTFTGIINPQISPDRQKIVYAIKDGENSGLWVLDLADKPLIFSKDPKQIAKDTTTLSFSSSDFSWAPDSKSIVSILQESSKTGSENTRTYLLSADQLNNDRLADITNTIDRTRKAWDEDKILKDQDRISRLINKDAVSLASSSANIIWSPDETKFISVPRVIKEKPEVQVYDTKKDKTFVLPQALKYVWYPDSNHIILIEDKAISIVEYNGDNKTAIYNGNFEERFVYPWPNGSKLIIAANYNPTIKEPNLYTINLR